MHDIVEVGENLIWYLSHIWLYIAVLPNMLVTCKSRYGQACTVTYGRSCHTLGLAWMI
jgi:hypothetical protein